MILKTQKTMAFTLWTLEEPILSIPTISIALANVNVEISLVNPLTSNAQ
jgi:hypothetical protein